MRGMSRERTSVGATQVEAALEARVRRRLERNPTRIAVRRAVGDQREAARPCPLTSSAASSAVAVPRERPSPVHANATLPGGDRPSGGRARRPHARSRRRARCRRRSRSGGRSPARAPMRRGRALPASRRAASADPRGSPSARGSTLVPPPGMSPSGVAVDAVQHLVERAVPAEDVQRIDLARGLARDLRRLAACRSSAGAPCPREAPPARRRARPRRPRRPRVRDQKRGHRLFTVPGTVMASRVRQSCPQGRRPTQAWRSRGCRRRRSR